MVVGRAPVTNLIARQRERGTVRILGRRRPRERRGAIRDLISTVEELVDQGILRNYKTISYRDCLVARGRIS